MGNNDSCLNLMMMRINDYNLGLMMMRINDYNLGLMLMVINDYNLGLMMMRIMNPEERTFWVFYPKGASHQEKYSK